MSLSQAGNNAFTLLVLLIVGLLVYAAIRHKSLPEVFEELGGIFKGEKSK